MSEERRLTAAELGVGPLTSQRGPVNAITDVPGVRVGHTTLIEGTSIRTGVTAVVPDGVDQADGELAAGLYVGNGFGKLIGATQLVELGVIETPIVLTGTLSAFRAADALLSYLLARPGNERMTTCNPVSATSEAACEAILNSLFLATTTTGYLGHTRRAVPLDYVTRACGVPARPGGEST